MATDTTNAAPRRKRRLWPKLLIGFVLVVVLLLAALPFIAGAVAPGIISNAIAGSINGKADVQRVSIGYFSGQHVGPVTVTDDQGQQVGQLNVSVHKGLLGLASLALGGSDVGTIDVSGSLKLDIDKDGKTTLDRLLKTSATPAPTPAPSGSTPPAAPKPVRAITARLNVDALDVIVNDQRPGRGQAAIKNLKGGGTISTRDPIALQFDATVEQGATAATEGSPARPAQAGSLKIKADVTDAFDASGNLQTDLAKVDATITGTGLPTSLIDVAAGPDLGASALIGPQLNVNVGAKGSLANLQADVGVNSDGIKADAGLLYAKAASGTWLTATKPLTVNVEGQRALAMPVLAKALKGQDALEVKQLPQVTIAVDTLKLRLPGPGEDIKKLDMRGSAIAAKINTGPTTGLVRVPKQDGTPGDLQPYALAPVSATLAAPDLAAGAKFNLNTSVTLNQQPAGVIESNVQVASLLDEQGALRTIPGDIAGNVSIKELATALGEPFVKSMGLELARDVGPKLDLELSAKQQAAGSEPAVPTVTLRADSKNIKATGLVRIEQKGDLIVSPADAFNLQIASAGPAIGGILAKNGVTEATGLPVSVVVKNLRVEPKKLAKPGMDMVKVFPDLRAISGVIDVQLGAGSLKAQVIKDKPVSLVEILPGKANVDLSKLAAGELNMSAQSAFKLDGQPAGSLNATVAGTKLLDGQGWIGGIDEPNRLGVKVALVGVSTALAQPFAASSGLDIPSDIGPRLDAQFTATNIGKAEPGAPFPPIGTELRIGSERLTIIAPIDVSAKEIRTASAGPAQILLQKPGQIIGRFAKPETGVRVSPDGWMKVIVKDLVVPLAEKKAADGTSSLAPMLHQASASAEFATGGFEVQALNPAGQPQGDPLKINQVFTNATLAPAKPARLDIKGSMIQGPQTALINGGFDLPGLFKDDQLTPMMVRPVGQLEIKDLPTLLAKLVPPGAPTKDAQGNVVAPMDLGSLAQAAIGPAFTLTLKSEKAPNNAPGIIGSFNMASERLNGYLVAAIDEPLVKVRGGAFNIRSNPDAFNKLMTALSPAQPSPLTLAGGAQIGIKLEEFQIPMDPGFKPNLAKAGTAKLSAVMEAPLLIDGLVQIEDPQTKQKRSTGPVGVDKDFRLDVAAPLASLQGGAEPAKLVINGTLLGGAATSKLATLKVDATAPLATGPQAAPIQADLALSELTTPKLDEFLGQPGLISEALGPTATLTANVSGKLPDPSNKSNAVTATVNLVSPLAKLTTPVQLTLDAARLTIASPIILDWQMQPAWADRTLLGATGAKDAPEPPVRFTSVTPINVRIPKLSVAMGEAPLKPGVFAVDAIVTAPKIDLKPTGDAPPQSLSKLQLRTASAERPGEFGFNVEAAHEGGPADKPALKITGAAYNVSDAAGKLTTDKAVITANGQANDFPIGLVDALAKQRGMLVEALGPKGQMTFAVEGFSKTAGKLSLDASSARANASLKGRIEGGTFVNEQPAEFTLIEIQPGLGKKLVPMVGVFEKRPEDGPAKITITGLRAPLDGDLGKLNGDVKFELGQARFSTGEIFGSVLKAVGGKQAGVIGKRIEPFEASIRNGVVKYDRFALPLGEFALATEGSIDLKQRTVDVLTFLPLGSISDETAGLFKKGIGSITGDALQASSMLPFRTKGSFDKPKTEPDLKVFAEEAVNNLTKDVTKDPGKLLEGLLKKKDKDKR